MLDYLKYMINEIYSSFYFPYKEEIIKVLIDEYIPIKKCVELQEKYRKLYKEKKINKLDWKQLRSNLGRRMVNNGFLENSESTEELLSSYEEIKI